MMKDGCFMKKIWIYIFGGLAILTPAVAYVIKFHGCSISDDPADWGVFGDYFGGVYSIIVTILAVYLANELSKRNDSQKRMKDAIEEIYEQILTIEKGDTVDLRRVNKLFRLISDNKLYLPKDMVASLKELADNFLENKDDRDSVDKNLLSDTKIQLKRIYDS